MTHIEDARDPGYLPPTVVPNLTDSQKAATTAVVRRLRMEFARHATGAEFGKALGDMTSEEVVEICRLREADKNATGKLVCIP